MALNPTIPSDSFEQWRIKTNQIAEDRGDLAVLTTTTKITTVAAINELNTAKHAYIGIYDYATYDRTVYAF